MNTNVAIQTFWSRYKVIIFGAVMSLMTALSPLITAPKDQLDYKALLVAGIIAVATFLGKEARGKNWTILGQVAAALVVVSGGINNDLPVSQLIFAAFASFFSVPLSQIKLSTYESSAPILEAKKEAVEIKKLRDINASKDDVQPTRDTSQI